MQRGVVQVLVHQDPPPIEFYLKDAPASEHERVAKLVAKCGGSMVQNPACHPHAIRLGCAEPGTQTRGRFSSRPDTFSVRFVDDCVAAGRLLSLSQYRLEVDSLYERPDEVMDVLLGRRTWLELARASHYVLPDSDDDTDLLLMDRVDSNQTGTSFRGRAKFTHAHDVALLQLVDRYWRKTPALPTTKRFWCVLERLLTPPLSSHRPLSLWTRFVKKVVPRLSQFKADLPIGVMQSVARAARVHLPLTSQEMAEQTNVRLERNSDCAGHPVGGGGQEAADGMSAPVNLLWTAHNGRCSRSKERSELEGEVNIGEDGREEGAEVPADPAEVALKRRRRSASDAALGDHQSPHRPLANTTSGSGTHWSLASDSSSPQMETAAAVSFPALVGAVDPNSDDPGADPARRRSSVPALTLQRKGITTAVARLSKMAASSSRTASSPSRTASSPRKTAASSSKTAASSSKTAASPRKTAASPNKTTVSPNKTAASPRSTAVGISSMAVSLVSTTASPSRTSVSPNRTSVSPSRTSVSPSRTSVSPNRTSVSPNRTSVSPNRTSVSPNRTSVSPSGTSVSPSRTSVSPSRTSVSPNRTSASPSRTSAFPSGTSASPSKTAASPSKAAACPSRVAADPSGTTADPSSTTAGLGDKPTPTAHSRREPGAGSLPPADGSRPETAGVGTSTDTALVRRASSVARPRRRTTLDTDRRRPVSGAGSSAGGSGGRSSRAYTGDEDIAILKRLLTEEDKVAVSGRRLWQLIASERCVPGRTWQSLKQRFLAVIQPRIESYQLTDQECDRLRSTRRARDRTRPHIAFCRWEDVEILRYLAQSPYDAYLVRGKSLWEDMWYPRCRRTWQSRKERFFKHILPNIQRYKEVPIAARNIIQERVGSLITGLPWHFSCAESPDATEYLR